MKAGPVALQAKSSNRKLAPQMQVKFPNGWRRNEPLGPFVASTYVSIAATCPSSCSFKDAGCYVQVGPTARHSAALDASAIGMTPTEVTLAEAALIDRTFVRGVPQDGARGGRDLRLHVGGDVSGELGAVELGEAAQRWRARGGGRVWTYTHRWKTVPRAAWGPWVSVLASCDNADEVEQAHARGYAAALVVPEFPREHRAFSYPRRSWDAVPCPVEAGAELTCAQCRLCMDDVELDRRRLVIAFAVHGPQDSSRKRLAVLP